MTVLDVDGTGDIGELGIGIGFANLGQDGAGFREARFLREPARAARDREEHQQEQQGGDAGDAEHPAPFRGAELLATDKVVREIGDENSGDDVELKKADQAAAQMGRRDFGDVHGAEDGGAADGESADEAEEDERIPIPGDGAAQGGEEIEDGHEAEAVAAAVAIAGESGEDGADHGANECDGDGEAEAERREREGVREIGGGAGDDGGVEAEEKTAEGGDDGAADKNAGEGHWARSASTSVPRIPAREPSCGV